jgi:cell envelope opacity-associated protein A
VYALAANTAQQEAISEQLPTEEIEQNPTSIPNIQVVPSSTTTPITQAPENTTGRTFFSVQELFRAEQVNTTDVYDLE